VTKILFAIRKFALPSFTCALEVFVAVFVFISDYFVLSRCGVIGLHSFGSNFDLID